MKNKLKQAGWKEVIARICRTPDWKILLVVYFLFSAIRFILALATTVSPSIYPDESLYINLAKGIATQGQTLFNAQRINYIFLFYSILLAPLYLITDTVDVFRSIQALNSLLISLSVFPVFALGKLMTGNRTKAWAAAMFVLLLPDMALSRHILEENLALPAQFTAFLLIYKCLKDEVKAGTLIAAVVTCSLLPFIKPYLLAVGAAFCLAMWIKAITARVGKIFYRAFFCSSALAFLVFIIYKGLLLAFTKNTGGETIFYVSNIGLPSFLQIINTLKASSLYLYFFTAACCVLPVLVPTSHIAKLSHNNRYFMFFILVAWLVTILGSSYTINLNEMKGNFLSGRVHLRYIDAYMLLFILVSLGHELNGRRINITLGILFMMMLLGNIFLGATASTSGDGNILDILPMAMFIENVWMSNSKVLLQVLLTLGMVAAVLIMAFRGWSDNVRRATLCLLTLSFVLNNAAGYHSKLKTSTELTRDAREIGRAVGSEPTVILAKNGELITDETTALDTYLRRSVPAIQLDSLLYSLGENSAYRPFYPNKIKAEAIVTDVTPSSAWLVLIADSLEYMELLPDTASTVSSGGMCAAVWVDEGVPWLRSALAGHTNGILENSGTILVFDSDLVSSGRIRLDLKIQSQANGSKVQFSTGADTRQVEVGISVTPVGLDIAVPRGTMPIRIDIGCETGPLRITEYHLNASNIK